MGTVRIPLTQGKYALIDEEDYPLVGQHRWHTRRCNHLWYAQRNVAAGPGKQKKISMHQEILGLGPGVLCDHKNGNGLDNRRSNLRPANYTQNAQNKSGRARSGFKGVYFFKRPKKWMAQITSGQNRLFLGYFHTAEEAAHAYDRKARELFGPYARVNFPVAGECHSHTEAEKIGHDHTVLRPKSWSRTSESCRECGTTNRAHSAKGFCTACYLRRHRRGGS